MTNTPRFKHDCDGCVYLGQFDQVVDDDAGDSFERMRHGLPEPSGKQYDLYWRPSLFASQNLASLIARYGDEDPQYRSSHPPEAFTAGFVPSEIERETLARALVKGLYKPWERRLELEAVIRNALFDLDCDDPKAARATLEATGIKS